MILHVHVFWIQMLFIRSESRDLLFWLAFNVMYVPKWSKHIFDEWKDVMRRKGISQAEASKRANRANLAFPNATVTNYSDLIKNLNLPDPKDLHVLAAAIKVKAEIIVTNNVKDFPDSYMKSFGIEIKTADNFLSYMIDQKPEQAILGFHQMVENRRNPDLNEQQLLEILKNRGLTKTANGLIYLI